MPTPPRSDDLDKAIAAENAAYDEMRALVPDLALPRWRRPQLDRRQQAAVDLYEQARARTAAARKAHDRHH